MLNIIIFRHGKSDWGANYDMDHNRPLSKRGYKAEICNGIDEALEVIDDYLKGIIK